MDERTFRVLEFFKIRDRLVAFTVTAPGREIAQDLTPSPDPQTVRAWQQKTQEAVALLVGGEVPLRGTTDLRVMVHDAQIGAALPPPDFLALKGTLATIRQCKKFVQARRERVPALAAVAGGMHTFESLEEAIGRTIADDGTIPDTASHDLARCRREHKVTQARVQEKLDDLLRGPYARMLQDAIVTTRGDRYVVPVKQEFKNQFPGVLHDQSSSGATAFMEPLVVLPLGNRLRELDIAEREEIARLLRELATRVGADAEPILSAYDALGQIDFAVAKALLAEQMQAAGPHIRTDGVLEVRRARHPLLAGDVVPIDLSLGNEFTTLVITGPNTGGKTVTLKTIGLLTLMAQAGLFVPADDGAEVSVFPQVFADVGDEQSIEQSLSTFSSHMGAIAGILGHLRDAQGPALVLLDEIGAGTDPTEGVALARSLIEHLHASGARTAVTTHYNELKALAYTHRGIQNASVEFDTETLQPTYHLRLGIPGRSNALIIARRLGLDPAIVERAQSVVGAELLAIDRVLSDIEADRKAYEWELAQAAKLRAETEMVQQRTEQELARLRGDRQRVLAKLREEGEALLARIRREMEAVISTIKTSPSPQTIQQAREHVRQLADDLQEQTGMVQVVPGEPLDTVHPGQQVFVVPLNRLGTVLAADERGDVEVEVGTMRARVPLASLRALPEVPAVAPGSPAGSELVELPAVPLSISIRGQRVEEAIPVVDKYLDNAYLAGLRKVTVVHGKGTGALRKAVHEFLGTHPHVRAFRLGERGEGDTGATIVDLKE